MPLVSEEFVKHAQALAEGVPALQAKLAETEKQAAAVQVAPKVNESLIEATVNTLVSQGLIPATEKSAAIANLKDPEQILQALNKTAQLVRAETMGSESIDKSAGVASVQSESDRTFLSRLGF